MTTPWRISAGTVLGLVLVGLASVSFLDPQLDQMSLWAVQSLLALSLIIVWGRGGMFSLGQSGLYGVGAYAFGIVAVNLADTTYLPWALLTAVAVTAIVALIIGYFTFYGSVSELNVAIITLAITLVTYSVLNNLGDPKYAIGDAKLGGYNGMAGIPILRLGGPESEALTKQQTFILLGILTVLTTALVCAVMASSFGRVLNAVRSNDYRAGLLGYDVRRYRLLAFVLGGVVAGWGGALFAAWGSYVSPGLFTLQPAILVIIWVLVGGRSYLLAAVVGTFLVQSFTRTLGGTQGEYAPIILGIALIVIVMVAPQGLLGLIARIPLLNRFAPKAPAVAPTEPPTPDDSAPPVSLRVAGVRKNFGGLSAVDGVDLDFSGNGIHCLIGPNGAGKSTLFALLAGTQRVTDGTVTLGDTPLRRLSPFRRARLGLGIKTQTASVFDELTVRENLWLATFSLSRSKKVAAREAQRLLEEFDLSHQVDEKVSTLSHGQQQWLEIAMVAARRPSVLLLDEPTAGMSREETRRTAALVRKLAENSCVVVIEHDMSFVRDLDADITVLHLGRVLATGELAELEKSETIRAVYLGVEHA